MTQIKWHLDALVDFERLYLFLSNKNPDAANRAATTILEGAKMLEFLPQLGRPMEDGTGKRELFVSFASGWYVLRYILENEHCIILCVWHSRDNRMH